MSKPANTTLIGIFVLAGLALAIGSFVIASSLKLFSNELRCVLYFDESVNNLDVGSPVKFKGVPVGKVDDIRIKWNQHEHDDSIPVFVTIDLKRLNNRLGAMFDINNDRALEKEIQKGLRGRLQMQSIVTGLLFVDLNYVNNPTRPLFHQQEVIYPEIPTLPSELSEYGESLTAILGKIAALDIKGISDNINSLLITAREEIKGANLPRLSSSITATSNSINQLATSKQVENTLIGLQETLQQLKQLAIQLENRANSVADKTESLQDDLRGTLKNIDLAVSELHNLLSPESSTRYNLDKALGEMTRAAEAATQLLEFIDRNPKAFISGRAPPAKPEPIQPSSVKP